MEPREQILIDAECGIEYRALPTGETASWVAQWRPIRALRNFMTFSYISRKERFETRSEALEFIRKNARAIAEGAL
jgi:hypothetical protein